MQLEVRPSKLKGRVEIPASKSHTIRALVLASLAEGESKIINPLLSEDAISCLLVCKAFGATIVMGKDWLVKGKSGNPDVPEDIINVGNSGTTARLTMGMASLGSGYAVFTGDAQTRQRPMQPLLDALNNLGATAFSTRGNGKLPAVIRGRIKGGGTDVDGLTSQYLSSLLISSPLAERDTIIRVHNLHEKPYVEMTLRWLKKLGIQYENKDLEQFHIEGNQRYRCFEERIPADFSSATFFLCAAVITHCELDLVGLDFNDSQGDKMVVPMLEEMGARYQMQGDILTISGLDLKGAELDLNATPDALPALAVVGTQAEGETILRNVPQARIKETDRIAVMCQELTKMGADIQELPDGLVIRKSRLKGTVVDGHGDHRVVMSLAIAGLVAEGTTRVKTAEAMSITFPNFAELMSQCGAQMEFLSDET
ncbi:MAG: 3-phosphoshikimate 1-carboxyvinyltransferase [Candidatus Tectomicrobia bacterium]|uniref:3-phosphoshikimate 1-carboxyvinyltransferase n=1 Tax=Tectimicrobiota bacterium TaxID=2528274 RepID=A0A933LQL5_UNCTE|nr:3-phosphoshikimate 1-carboxyvinyltransferase [Candidatus Tectomicrobia bacterium]